MANWREEAGKRLKEKQSKGRFKLVEGENSIRVLPNAKGAEFKPFIEYMVHMNVGPDKRFVRCAKNIHGEGACWLCDKLIPKLAESKHKGKRIVAEAMQPKEQFSVQVAVLDSDTGKFRGPYMWNVSTGGAKSLSAKLLGVIKSTKRDYIDAKNGYNLNIERTGTGMMDTTYGAIIPDEDPSKVPDSLLAKVKRFAELIDQYSEEKQKAAYFGRKEEEEAEEEEEEKTEEETEEDGEESSEEESGEEETEEVEEEEEEAPKLKGGKKKPKKPVEEEEEAEEEEVVEEDGEEEVTEDEEEVPEDEEGDGEESSEEESGEEDIPEDEEEEAPKPENKKPAPKPISKKPVKKHGKK